MDTVRNNITFFIDSVHEGLNPVGWSILEIGCGNLSHNKEIFGKDNLFVATDVYKSEAADQILDIEHLQTYPKHLLGTWDMVIISEVLEHVFDFDQALINCNRLLRKDGVLLVTMPWDYPQHAEQDYRRLNLEALCLELTKRGFIIQRKTTGLDDDTGRMRTSSSFVTARKLLTI